MERPDVLGVYDDGYAEAYDARFLLAEWPKLGADFEAEVLRGLLDDEDPRWLDVGCGTGYFLSRFPGVERAGLDISPAMLEQARRANPDATFHEGDFRDDVEEWHGAWSVVSCMWTAYNYVESMPELDRLIAGFVRWTRPGGSVFVPVMDMEDLRQVEVPYEEDPEVWGGTIALTGVTWTWDEPLTGKHHEHLVAPQVGHVVALLEPHFEKVEVVRYPVFRPGWISRKAVVATGRRRPGSTGSAEVVWHPRPRHPDDVAADEERRRVEEDERRRVEEDERRRVEAEEARVEAERARVEEERRRAEAEEGRRAAAEVEVAAALAHAEHARDHLRSELDRMEATYGGALPPLPDGGVDLSSTSTRRLVAEAVRRVNPLRPGFVGRLRRRLRR